MSNLWKLRCLITDVDDQLSSTFDDEFAHGTSSNINNSYHPIPAETSTRPRGPVRFSLKPARRSFARLRRVVLGASTGPTSSKVLCVVSTIMLNSTTGRFHYIPSLFRSARSNQPITIDIVLFSPVETLVVPSSKVGGILTLVRETGVKPTLRYVLVNALHTQFH